MDNKNINGKIIKPNNLQFYFFVILIFVMLIMPKMLLL